MLKPIERRKNQKLIKAESLVDAAESQTEKDGRKFKQDLNLGFENLKLRAGFPFQKRK